MNWQSRQPRLMVVDPGVKTPELDTFNNIAAMVPVACSYHLPALFGFDSFPADIRDICAVIVLGSASSVHERAPWQIQLEDWIRLIVEQGTPVLGCCYGHQMLAYMYGGQVAYVYPNQVKLQGIREVDILENPLWDKGPRQLIVTHNEQVIHLPADFQVIATSQDVGIDGFMHKTKPIFGFQAHPEATKSFVESRQMPVEQAIGVISEGHDIIRRFVHMAIDKWS
jgi:GMP synthase-like glutamine amidotransferase